MYWKYCAEFEANTIVTLQQDSGIIFPLKS